MDPRTNKDSDPDYVPPKKPYSFLAMLDDILAFASDTLVDEGRLSFWTPTANDEELEIPVPTHPCLEIVAICVQPFNKCRPRSSSRPRYLSSLTLTYTGSRRLITYRRIPDAQVLPSALEDHASRKKLATNGTTADELNPFRRGYFKKFEADE